MRYCVTEEMVADLLTKIVVGAQDDRLTIRFYNLCPSGTYYVINHFLLNFVYSYFEHAISYQIAMFDGE
jgi:hypothetical protein